MLHWAIFVATVGLFQTKFAVRFVKQTDRRVHRGDFFQLSWDKSAEERTNDSKSGLATESVFVHRKNREVRFSVLSVSHEGTIYEIWARNVSEI